MCSDLATPGGRSRPPARSRGFTVIELLGVMVVGGVLLAAMTSFYLSEQRALRQQQIQVATSQKLRTALEQMVRDLRTAGRNPTDASGIGITYADAQRVEFTLDADWDGTALASEPTETKGFRLVGDELQTYVANAPGLVKWLPLADSLATGQAVFTYYRGDESKVTALPANTTDRAAIRRIDVTLRVTDRVPDAPDIDRRESTRVRLRNLD